MGSLEAPGGATGFLVYKPVAPPGASKRGSLFSYPQIPPPGVFKGDENELYKGLGDFYPLYTRRILGSSKKNFGGQVRWGDLRGTGSTLEARRKFNR